MTPEVVGGIITFVSAKLDEELEPVTRGHSPHPVTGQKLEYNKQLRVMCFRLAGSLLKANGKYSDYYNDQKRKLVSKYAGKGIKIIPTLELPKNNRKFFEPVGTIAEGHVHMQAMRKMIKLFLSHLWLVWREAKGLPVTEPYAYAVQGHTKHDYIGPWEMVEKPEPRAKRQRKSAAAGSAQAETAT